MGDILYLMLMDVLEEPNRNTQEYLLSPEVLERFQKEADSLKQKLGKNFDENHTVRIE